jgi:hypothetical protein
VFGLIYPYGIVLQALAILHFVRRRPETYWLWIILMFGGVGALIYIFIEVIPDAGLLRATFQVYPRRKRIRELEALTLDNPSIGNYEELGDLYLDDRQFARARECFDVVKIKLEIVVPSISVLAEPSVAVVDRVVLRRGTRAVAQAYLEFLYTPEGQEIAAKNFYRPRDPAIQAKYAAQFQPVKLVDIDHFGGWTAVQKTHFASGGIFDQVTATGATVNHQR